MITSYLLAIVFLCAVPAMVTPQPTSRPAGQPAPRASMQQPKLHTLAEILQIMKASPLLYDYGPVPDSVANMEEPPARPVLRSKQFVKTVSGRPSLVEYSVTAEVQQQLDFLNESNLAKNYTLSLGFSKKMLDLDSTFNPARTLIGDAYYLLEKYDSSIIWLKEAIKHNYADYEAHWFLADALLAKHDTTAAIRELTIAHVLNVNASLLTQSLGEYRKLRVRKFEEREFRPYVSIKKNADTVFVRYSQKVEGYALVKAVWEHEPGYAEMMLGRKPDQVKFRMLEEREAINCLRETDTAMNTQLKAIEKAGLFDEFMIYEIAAPRFPEWIPTMSQDMIRRIAEYVDKFR